MMTISSDETALSPDDAAAAVAVAAANSAVNSIPSLKEDDHQLHSFVNHHQTQNHHQNQNALHQQQQHFVSAHLSQLHQTQMHQNQTQLSNHHQNQQLHQQLQQHHQQQQQHQQNHQHLQQNQQRMPVHHLHMQQHLAQFDGQQPQMQQVQVQQVQQVQMPSHEAHLNSQLTQQLASQQHFVHGQVPQQLHQNVLHQQAQQQQQQHHQQQHQQHPGHVPGIGTNHQYDLLTGTATPEADLLESGSRKVAPRSSDLFKVGPPFSETRHHQDIYCKSNDLDVNPILEARIDRGFETGENGTWIGYKRNYFTLVAAFSLENFDFDRFIQNKFYTFEKASRNGQSVGENKVEINYFAIRLVAKCSDDDVSISLIQHTAKRDKGPQFPPPIYPAVPGEMPDHETVKASCNKRNGSKIENMNKIFYFDRSDYYHTVNLDSMKDDTILKNYPSDSISRIARFERIQFTSSIRVKQTSANSRYFTLHVELLGIVEDEDLQIQPILLSSIETPPLIVRGRSPSNYHKERTSGYRGHLQGH